MPRGRLTGDLYESFGRQSGDQMQVRTATGLGHGATALRLSILMLVSILTLGVFSSIALAAGTATWSGEYPAKGAALTKSISSVHVDTVNSLSLTSSTKKVVVDGTTQISYITFAPTMSGHWVLRSVWDDDAEMWVITSVWVLDPNTKSANVLSYVDVKTDGPHTVAL